MRRADWEDDEGAVLLLVLIFLGLFGLIAALLSQGDASLKTTAVVHHSAGKILGADAGIEYGIDYMQRHSEVCDSPEAGLQTLPAVAVDPELQDVTVTCSTIDGRSSGLGGFAIYSTSTAADSIQTSSGQSKVIEGPVHSSGGYNLSKPLAVNGGDATRAGPSCSGDAPTMTPPFVYRCPGGPSQPTVTLPARPNPVADLQNPAGQASAGCRSFSPGYYAAKPILSSTQSNYLKSGVYVFNNIGDLHVKQLDVYGGQPDTTSTPPETRMLTAGAPCGSDPANSGTGVLLIFEGNSRIILETGGRMELFGRVPSTPDSSTPRLSMVFVPPGTPGGYQQTSLGNTLAIDQPSGNTPEFVSHGGVYAPTVDVELFATNTSDAQMLNGVVARKILLQSSASANGLNISLKKGAGKRRIVLTATAAVAGGGERTIKSVAVVDVANDAARTVTVRSRRIEN